MTLPKKNVEQAFMQLAVLQSIQLESGWKLEIAKFFNVNQNYVSKWISRGRVPKKRQEYAIKMGYPLEKWYLTTSAYEPVKETMLSQEDTRNPASSPSYAITPDHLNGRKPTGVIMKVKPNLAPLVNKLEATLNEEDEIRGIIRAIDRGDGDTLKSVVEILNSGESGTIMALKMNVAEFSQKVRERTEYRELKATVGMMKKRQDDMEMLLKSKTEELDTARQALVREKTISDSLIANPADPAEND